KLQAGRTCSIDLEPHCSRNPVHRPRERIEAMKVGASISVDNQRVLAGRATVERTRIGDDSGFEIANGVASGWPTTRGVTTVGEGSARGCWRRRSDWHRSQGGHKRNQAKGDEPQPESDEDHMRFLSSRIGSLTGVPG